MREKQEEEERRRTSDSELRCSPGYRSDRRSCNPTPETATVTYICHLPSLYPTMSVRFSLPPSLSLPTFPSRHIFLLFRRTWSFPIVDRCEKPTRTLPRKMRIAESKIELRVSCVLKFAHRRRSSTKIVLSSSSSSLLLAIQRRCFIATCDDLRSTILASEEPDRSTQVHARSYRNVLSRVLSGFRDGPRNEIVFLKSCLL